jgi:hypothetical protein
MLLITLILVELFLCHMKAQMERHRCPCLHLNLLGLPSRVHCAAEYSYDFKRVSNGVKTISKE